MKNETKLTNERNSSETTAYIPLEVCTDSRRRLGSILRAVIVDDDPSQRTRLRQLVDARDEVRVVGEFADEAEALQHVEHLEPNLVLLDAYKSDLDPESSQLLAALPQPPAVVFVAPSGSSGEMEDETMSSWIREISKPRNGGKIAIKSDENPDAIKNGTSDGQSQPRRADRLAIKDGARFILVRTDDISWIEAAGNYARIHTSSGTHLMRATMRSLVDRLDPTRFARIHRSTIVNLDAVSEIQPMFHGEYVVILHDGTKLAVSRTYRNAIIKLWS